MELKKNPKADLNLQRTLFFQIGLCVALAGTLYAFNWREGDGEAGEEEGGGLDPEELEEKGYEMDDEKERLEAIKEAAGAILGAVSTAGVKFLCSELGRQGGREGEGERGGERERDR